MKANVKATRSPNMQRELKFRLWNGSKMLTMKQVACVPPLMSTLPCTLDDVFRSLKDGYSLMQYVGLSDSNGEEMYEKDIVLVTDLNTDETAKSVIEWNTQIARFVFVRGFLGTGPYTVEKDNDIFKVEVIGNIYENPDILPSYKPNES